MALAGNVRAIIVKKLEQYEGRVPHLYRDTVGVVTVGVGHAVPSPAAAASLALWTVKDGKPLAPATPDQILADYQMVIAQPAAMAAGRYKHQLVMQDAAINQLRDADLQGFYKELQKRYAVAKGYRQEFDDFPADVQIALFDMIFNLGGPKLTKKFPSMNAAIKAGDWRGAAAECNRPGVPPARNGFVRKRFEAAAASAPPTVSGPP
jgi:GH24 family phage-related lysozyme (muramidase)